LAHLPVAKVFQHQGWAFKRSRSGRNFSPAPHCDLNDLLASTAGARISKGDRAGALQLAALNCSAQSVHPKLDLPRGCRRHAQDASPAGLLGWSARFLHERLPGNAGRWPQSELGSGIVAGGFPGAPEWQWRAGDSVLKEMAELAKTEIRQLCFELHPGMAR
jgi:hypothetical protein